MSQFMMCKADVDLVKYGGKLLNPDEAGNTFFYSVRNKYFMGKQWNNIWIIENIHKYCDEVLDYHAFMTSEFYDVLDSLYDLCECIILWYGDEYDDLEEVYTKEEFISYIQQGCAIPC